MDLCQSTSNSNDISRKNTLKSNFSRFVVLSYDNIKSSVEQSDLSFAIEDFYKIFPPDAIKHSNQGSRIKGNNYLSEFASVIFRRPSLKILKRTSATRDCKVIDESQSIKSDLSDDETNKNSFNSVSSSDTTCTNSESDDEDVRRIDELHDNDLQKSHSALSVSPNPRPIVTPRRQSCLRRSKSESCIRSSVEINHEGIVAATTNPIAKWSLSSPTELFTESNRHSIRLNVAPITTFSSIF